MIKKEEIYIDNLIVGSGYGGAVTALRLTQAGKPCVMLEMGVNWETTGKEKLPFSRMIKPTNASTWLRNKTIAPFLNVFFFFKKYTGVLYREDLKNIKIYKGRGVGGGSLVNGGMAVLPKKEYFSEIFPSLDTELFYQKYFPLAEETLITNTIPKEYFQESDYYGFARLGQKEAEKAGYKTTFVPNVYDFNYMQLEEKGKVEKSALKGEVIYGNNHGKNSVDKTYLRKALATGLLTILDLHRVDDISENTAGYVVFVSVINTEGKIIAQKNIHCKKLFLAAGSMGTSKLLMKAKATGSLSQLNEFIGKEWGNNGNIMCGRNMVNTVFNRTKNSPHIGLGIKQSTIPVNGIDNWGQGADGFFTEIAPLPTGMEFFTALYLVINRVPEKGYFEWDNEKHEVKLVWEEKNYQQALKNAKGFIQTMIKANGGTRSLLLFHAGFGYDICYHPLGGAVLGKVTDNFGRVKRYKNLYVMDGSLIPASIGVNPFLTITALAEHNIENIIAQDF